MQKQETRVICQGNSWVRNFVFTEDDDYHIIKSDAGSQWLYKHLHKMRVPVIEYCRERILDTEVLEMVSSSDKHYYVKRKLGFITPYQKKEQVLNESIEATKKDIAVIWDEGTETPFKIVKNAGYYVWIANKRLPNPDDIKKFNGDTVTITTVDVLRENGAFITQKASWERSALNVVWQCCTNINLSVLKRSKVFIVLIDNEGAVVFDNSEGHKRTLWFNSKKMEGDLRFIAGGDIPDTKGLVILWIIKELYEGVLVENPWVKLLDSLDLALSSAIKMYEIGYNVNAKGKLIPAFSKLFINKSDVKSISIPANAGTERWQILQTYLNSTDKRAFNENLLNIVYHGISNSLSDCPVLTIGDLNTADRFEIEGFMDVQNLIREYVNSNDKNRPLCLSVFGAPGSGKSFGITEIAKSVLPKRAVRLEFNLSQMTSPSDLHVAFHQVRDIVLSGSTPIAFFDEFDTNDLEWLKYFLVPMQDGFFLEGSIKHPLGKCIFVFAGGCLKSFDDFAKLQNNDEHAGKKIPDFLSRLRGYVNIMGVNPKDDNDRSYLIRRAVILRGLIERKQKNLFKGDYAQVNINVLKALLFVSNYKHGVRSMEAIIDMSRLAGKKVWDLSCLPSPDQLELHVDSKEFNDILLDDILWNEIVERVAFELYTDSKQSDDWVNCWEQHKFKYRDMAKDYCGLLFSIGKYDLHFNFDTGEKPSNAITFTDEDYHGIAKKWIGERDTGPNSIKWDNMDTKTQEHYISIIKDVFNTIQKTGMCLTEKVDKKAKDVTKE